MSRENILDEIIDYLNDNYNQESENYDFFMGPKPVIVKYSDDIPISFWACGAIVCIDDILHFISEDDGNWFREDNPCFSIAWTNSYISALINIKEYVNDRKALREDNYQTVLTVDEKDKIK